MAFGVGLAVATGYGAGNAVAEESESGSRATAEASPAASDGAASAGGISAGELSTSDRSPTEDEPDDADDSDDLDADDQYGDVVGGEKDSDTGEVVTSNPEGVEVDDSEAEVGTVDNAEPPAETDGPASASLDAEDDTSGTASPERAGSVVDDDASSDSRVATQRLAGTSEFSAGSASAQDDPKAAPIAVAELPAAAVDGPVQPQLSPAAMQPASGAPDPVTSLVSGVVGTGVNLVSPFARVILTPLLRLTESVLDVVAPQARPSDPTMPIQNTGLWALYGWVRRELDKTFFDDKPIVDVQTTQRAADGTISGLLNASDAEGDTLTYRIVRGPVQGSVVVDAAGGFVYTPDPGVEDDGRRDRFIVAITDYSTAFGLLPMADRSFVPVTVVRGNTDPRQVGAATVDSYDRATGRVTGLLNVVDVDGDPIVYRLAAPVDPALGTLDLDASTGAWVFTPTAAARARATGSPGDISDDVVPFTFVADDGRPSDAAAKTLTANAPLVPTVTVTYAGNDYYSSYTRTYYNAVSQSFEGPAIVVPSDDRFRVDLGDLRPGGLALSADARYAYVTAAISGRPNQNGNLQVIDLASSQVRGAIPVGPSPRGVVLSPDGMRAYVANRQSGSVSVVDLASLQVTATIQNAGKQGPVITPGGIALSQDGRTLFVTDTVQGGGTVQVIDTATNRVTRRLQVDVGTVRDIALTPDAETLYVGGSRGVAVVDTATGAVTSRIALTYGVREGEHWEYAPGGNCRYCAPWRGTPGGSVLVPAIDESFTPGALQTWLSADGSTLYVTTSGTSGQLNEIGPMVVIDIATNKISVNVGSPNATPDLGLYFPANVTADPTRGIGLVPNQSTVQIYDLATNRYREIRNTTANFDNAYVALSADGATLFRTGYQAGSTRQGFLGVIALPAVKFVDQS